MNEAFHPGVWGAVRALVRGLSYWLYKLELAMNNTMLRFHSLTAAYVRNTVRMGSMVREKNARTTAHQAICCLSQSSQVLTPHQQPLPVSAPHMNINGHKSEPPQSKLLPHDDHHCIGGKEDGECDEEGIDMQQQQPPAVSFVITSYPLNLTVPFMSCNQ